MAATFAPFHADQSCHPTSLPSWIVYAQCRPVPLSDGDYAANLQRVGVIQARDADKFDRARQEFGVAFPVLQKIVSPEVVH